MALSRRKALLTTLAERESFILRGFDFQEAEFAAARAKQSEKSRAGNVTAQKELGRIKDQQRGLAARRQETLNVVRREPELIAARSVEFLAHALVVPSSDPADREQYDAKTEQVAISLAWAFEEWRHHDGHWSYWHEGDKRWYYTDGSHWYFEDGGAWRVYGFDKGFGREGFERGEYKVPGADVKIVAPRHGVWRPR